MTPSSAKAKGRNFCSKIKTLLLTHFPTLEDGDILVTSAGVNGEDLVLSPAARKLAPIQIEAKKHKSFAVYGIYDQAKSHGAHEPVVFIEADRRRPLVILDAEYYLRLLARLAYGK